MNTAKPTSLKLAVLFDAENASQKYVEPLFRELAGYGTSQVRRAYPDWTAEAQRSWKEAV